MAAPARSHAPAPRVRRAGGARAELEVLLDGGRLTPYASGLRSRDVLGFDDGTPYRERLAAARRRCGSAEAFLAGEGRIGGRHVACGAYDFEFLGGGMGAVVGEEIARLFDRARERDLPVVLLHRSGGARMQEGTWSLIQVAKVCAAVARHRRTSQLFVSVLRDPTMGGVLASSGALGDVVLAESGARIGFAGQRVVRETIQQELPEGVQTAEALLANGFADAVVAQDALRGVLARLLRARPSKTAEVPPPAAPAPRPAPSPRRMEVIRAARDPRRPRLDAWLAALLDDFLELRGDRCGGDDPAVRGGFARLAGLEVVVIGVDRGSDLPDLKRKNFGMPRPAGYRKATRLLALAEKLGLPVVSLLDTPGADSTGRSEREGQAFAIAETTLRIVSLRVPVVGLVFGEGGSGGAIALAPPDHLLMLERTHLSVISPEGCAAILWRSREHAARAADALRSTAADLVACGLADGWLLEGPHPLRAVSPALAARACDDLTRALLRLRALDADALLARRATRLHRDRAFTTADA